MVDEDEAWAPGGKEPPMDSTYLEEVEAFLAEITQDREEPIEEGEAIQVLATWKETRVAVAEERKKRGLPPPLVPDL